MPLSPAELLFIHFNGTIPRGVYPNCTLKVDCDLTGYVSAQLFYYPSLTGNILYLGIFVVLLVVHIVQVILWKAWTYSIATVLGLALECVGYYGRIMLSGNPYVFNSFVIYLVALTVTPVFFTASIYFCLSRLILIYDPSLTLSHFAPKTYIYLFIGADFFSLVLLEVCLRRQILWMKVGQESTS